MNTELPLMSHVSLGTNNLDNALKFYDVVLSSIGAKRITDVPNIGASYGRHFPEFWVQVPFDNEKAEVANGVHFAFLVSDKEQVDRFYQTALTAGALSDGEPGPRPDYTDAYYGCFVRDLDGHKIEAMHWDETKTTGE